MADEAIDRCVMDLVDEFCETVIQEKIAQGALDDTADGPWNALDWRRRRLPKHHEEHRTPPATLRMRREPLSSPATSDNAARPGRGVCASRVRRRPSPQRERRKLSKPARRPPSPSTRLVNSTTRPTARSSARGWRRKRRREASDAAAKAAQFIRDLISGALDNAADRAVECARLASEAASEAAKAAALAAKQARDALNAADRAAKRSR